MSTFAPFTVSAPATTANLGPGYDCLGLALDLRNVLHVSPGTGLVRVRGEGAGEVTEDGANLVARAFDSVAHGLRGGVDLTCQNAVPLARGLGSSTAAWAVGAFAGWHIANITPSADLVLQCLADADGHADNAAPCAFGGMHVSWRAGASWHARRLPDPASGANGLRPVLFIPGRELSTAAARAAIPQSIDHADATAAVGTASAMVAAFAAGDITAASALAQSDLLHESHRAHLVPELAVLRGALHPLGCPATISGAGPTVLAWATSTNLDAVVATMQSLAGVADRVMQLDASADGVRFDT